MALFQGTPLLMQLFLMFFGLPMLGFRIEAWTAASLGLTFYASAYLAEIWRGGTQSLPKASGMPEPASACTIQAAAPHHPAASVRDHAAAGCRLSGAADQDHRADVDHRLRGVMRTANAINNATFEPFTVYGLVALIIFVLCTR